MARQRRIFVPGLSLHVIQRGVNRTAVFHHEIDYASFLAFLAEAAGRHGVAVHAYVLMTNHFHLIATPSDALALPRAMKELGARYVPYYNRQHNRIGTLWNGRYRGLTIDSRTYWLTCLRYIEQNPVRAGMTLTPGEYRWSSYAAHAHGEWPEWLSPHAVYVSLGSTSAERQAAYREICGPMLTADQLVGVRSGSDPNTYLAVGSDPDLTPT